MMSFDFMKLLKLEADQQQRFKLRKREEKREKAGKKRWKEKKQVGKEESSAEGKRR